MGEKQAILKLWKEGKLIRAIGQTLGIVNKTIWNVLVLLMYSATDREMVGQSKQQQLMTETLWELWDKTPKQQSLTSPTTTTVQEWTFHHPLFEEDFESRNVDAIPQDASHSSAVWLGRLDWNLQGSTEISAKSSGRKFYGLMRPKLISAKVMEKPNCRERKDMLMIHLWNIMEAVSWLGLAWLLLELADLY